MVIVLNKRMCVYVCVSFSFSRVKKPHTMGITKSLKKCREDLGFFTDY